MSSARTTLWVEATSRESHSHHPTFVYLCNPGSDSQITAQISVLNQDYASVGVSWVLAGTTHTVNSDWFNNVGPDSSQQTDMKTSLRQGGAADLNVYSVGFVLQRVGTSTKDTKHIPFSFKSGSGQGLLGYATFPVDYSANPKDDGVVILFSSVPGGASAPYDLGRVSFGAQLFFTPFKIIFATSDAHPRGRSLGRFVPYLPGWLQRCRRLSQRYPRREICCFRLPS